MNQDFEKELRRAEREKEQARRVESFWDAFRLTENGHVKSTLLLNSFPFTHGLPLRPGR